MRSVKILITVLIAAMLLTIMGGLTVSALTNYYTGNGSFESVGEDGALRNWGFIGASICSVERSSDYALNGSYSMITTLAEEDLATNTSASTIRTSGPFETFVTGEQYTVSIYAKTVTPLTNTVDPIFGAYLRVRANDANVYSADADIVVDTEGEWKQLTATFTANSEAPLSYIDIIISGNTAGTIYWDNFCINKTSELPSAFPVSVVKGNSTISETYGGFEGYTVGAAPGSSQWMHYAGFENGFIVTDECVHSGSKALKTVVTGEVLNPRAQYKPTIGGITLGATYEASIWVNVPASSTLTQVYLRFKNSTSYVYTPDPMIISGNTGGKWVRLISTFTAKADSSVNSVFIVCGDNSSGVVYWDDFTMIKIADAPSGFGFYDSTGREVENLNAGTTNAKYTIGSVDKAPVGSVLMLALYKTDSSGNKSLVAVSLDTKEETSTSMEASITIPNEGFDANKYSLSAMLWDSISTLHPVYLKKALE